MNPLDQLADISTPNAVSIWPLAWGYWLALAVLLIVIALSVIAIMRFRDKRRCKREAIKTLGSVATSHEYYAHKVQVLMKNLCAHYLPLSSSSQLHGQQWQLLVLSVYKGKDTQRLIEVLNVMYQALYSPKSKDDQSYVSQNEQTHAAVKDWIRTSFPCKSAQFDDASAIKRYMGEVHNA